MSIPVLTVSEYRRRFSQFVEEIMSLKKRIASLERNLEEENRLRGVCIDQLIALRKTK